MAGSQSNKASALEEFAYSGEAGISHAATMASEMATRVIEKCAVLNQVRRGCSEEGLLT